MEPSVLLLDSQIIPFCPSKNTTFNLRQFFKKDLIFKIGDVKLFECYNLVNMGSDKQMAL
jgi:hypothetical protein